MLKDINMGTILTGLNNGELARLENRLSRFLQGSEISLINEAVGIRPVDISYEVYDALSKAIRFQKCRRVYSILASARQQTCGMINVRIKLRKKQEYSRFFLQQMIEIQCQILKKELPSCEKRVKSLIWVVLGKALPATDGQKYSKYSAQFLLLPILVEMYPPWGTSPTAHRDVWASVIPDRTLV